MYSSGEAVALGCVMTTRPVLPGEHGRVWSCMLHCVEPGEHPATKPKGITLRFAYMDALQ